jgi:hypothetical protein
MKLVMTVKAPFVAAAALARVSARQPAASHTHRAIKFFLIRFRRVSFLSSKRETAKRARFPAKL